MSNFSKGCENENEEPSDRFCTDQTSWIYCTAINIFDLCSVSILSGNCPASCGSCKCSKKQLMNPAYSLIYFQFFKAVEIPTSKIVVK